MVRKGKGPNGRVQDVHHAAEQRAFVAATATGRDKQMPETVTLSNGIVFRIKAVPPLAIRQAAMRVAAPRVPKVLIEEKGREEDNPNDPAYLEELAVHEEATSLAALNVVLLLGTAVQSVPDDLSAIEADTWIDDLHFLGIDFDAENPRERYLAWIRFYATPTEEDLLRLLAGPMKAAGVTEGDVADAVASFRGTAERGVDQSRSPAASD